MKHVRYQRLLRLGSRGLELIQVPNPHPTLVLLGEPLPSAYLGLLESFRVLREADEAVSIQAGKTRVALKAFRKEYDGTRIMVASAHLETPRFEASSQFKVPEDLLENGKELRRVVEKLTLHAWAEQVLPILTQALDLAVRSRTTEVSARAGLQKAQAATHERADVLEDALSELRDGVRAVFGSKSREYQSIRPIKTHDAQDEQQAPIVDLPALKDNNSGQRAA